MIKGKIYFESKTEIKPRVIMYNGRSYDIIKLNSKYIIPKWYIIVDNKKNKIIKDIIICDCWHPNAWVGEFKGDDIDNPPKFSKFCIPSNLKGAKLVSNDLMKKYISNKNIRPDYVTYSKQIIEEWILKIWAMDNPHHIPLREHFISKPILPKEVK